MIIGNDLYSSQWPYSAFRRLGVVESLWSHFGLNWLQAKCVVITLSSRILNRFPRSSETFCCWYCSRKWCWKWQRAWIHRPVKISSCRVIWVTNQQSNIWNSKIFSCRSSPQSKKFIIGGCQHVRYLSRLVSWCYVEFVGYSKSIGSDLGMETICDGDYFYRFPPPLPRPPP